MALETTADKALSAKVTGNDIVPIPVSLVLAQTPAMRTLKVLTLNAALKHKNRPSSNYTDSIAQD